MDPKTWFALLRGRLDTVLNGDVSETQFIDVVRELAQNPDLSRGAKLHPDALLSLILAGAVSTGEIEEVASLLAKYCCNESTGFNIGIISAVTGMDDLGPVVFEL